MRLGPHLDQVFPVLRDDVRHVRQLGLYVSLPAGRERESVRSGVPGQISGGRAVRVRRLRQGRWQAARMEEQKQRTLWNPCTGRRAGWEAEGRRQQQQQQQQPRQQQPSQPKAANGSRRQPGRSPCGPIQDALVRSQRVNRERPPRCVVIPRLALREGLLPQSAWRRWRRRRDEDALSDCVHAHSCAAPVRPSALRVLSPCGAPPTWSVCLLGTALLLPLAAAAAAATPRVLAWVGGRRLRQAARCADSG